MSNTTHHRDELPPCDLVMRGGIASGVAYPLAIATLMRHFRLVAIGGASAGAIAAGVAAAAEYGRRADPRRDLTEALQRVTDEIGGGAGIKRLLRPDAPGPAGWIARALWSVPPWLPKALGRAAGRVALPLAGALVLALLLLLQGAPEAPVIRAVLAWVIVAAGIAAAAVACLAAAALLSLPRSGYGLCSGVHAPLNGDGAGPDATTLREGGALMDWLHAEMQDLAGLQAGRMRPGLDDAEAHAARPLLMRDLWDGDRFGPRRIDLLLTTTNLGQQLGQQFPFLERTRARLHFDPDELARVLPRDVVAWMVRKSRDPSPAARAACHRLRRLPEPEDLPVLFGVRMSLSFPGLIAAVPLHVTDDQGVLQRVWFSDGGITSNFPVDVFDAPLPRRPTFCINLRAARPSEARAYDPKARNEDALVIMAKGNLAAAAPVHGPARPGVLAFLSGIVDTARNARENELILTPGYSDRIVEVALLDNEGGLNLDMDRATIERIAKRGELAAQRLVERYRPGEAAAQDQDPIGWNNQRWIRLRATMAAQERLLADIRAAWWHRCDAWGSYPEVMRHWSPADPANAAAHPAGRIVPDYPWKDDPTALRALRMTLRLLELAETLEREAAAQAPDAPRQGRSVFDGVGDGRGPPGGGVASPRIGLRQRTVGGDPRANMTWR